MTVDRHRLGRLNRQRGKDTQREHARLYCGLWGVDPETHASWTQDEPDNLFRDCPGEGWYVSVKAEAVWSPWAYLIDAATRARDLPFWIGCRRPRRDYKRFREIWYAIVPEPVYLQHACFANIEGLGAAYPDGLGGLAFPGLRPQDICAVSGLETTLRPVLATASPDVLRDAYMDPAPTRWEILKWVPQIEELAGYNASISVVGDGRHVLVTCPDWTITVQLKEPLPNNHGSFAVITPARVWASTLLRAHRRVHPDA